MRKDGGGWEGFCDQRKWLPRNALSE
jgi:hypothetical protein